MKKTVKLALSTTVLAIAVGVFLVSPGKEELFWRSRGVRQVHLERQQLSKIVNFPESHPQHQSTIINFLTIAPTADKPGGYYSQAIAVNLSAESPGSQIYYTLDGSIPTRQSLLYKQPITINKTTVLRFRNFQLNHLPSETITQTYLINENFNLPVLSIVTDPVNLWDEHLGIYVQYKKTGRMWERNASIEYFGDRDSVKLRFPSELLIHGKTSRSAPKKSFRLRYSLANVTGVGTDNILTSGTAGTLKTVVVRNGGNRGNYISRLHSELFDLLYAEANGLSSAFQPSIVLVNGDYWGIYNLREPINTEYLERRMGTGDYELIKVWLCSKKDIRRDKPACYRALSGTKDHWYKTQEFFRTQDFSNDEVFKEAANWIDINNFTDYFLFQIYAENTDFPHNNTVFFRKLNDRDNRWKWVAWDSDFSFKKPEGSLIAFLLREDKPPQENEKNKNTLLLRKLLENESYRQRFITRMCDLLNSNFLPQRVEAKLDYLIDWVRDDLDRDWERWSIPEAAYWERVQVIRNFIYQRPDFVRQHFQQQFQLGRAVKLELFTNKPEGGTIQVNSLKPKSFPWQGIYFENLPIVLTADPAAGFEFAGWTDPSLGKRHEIQVELQGNLKIGAIFKPVRN